MWSSYPYDAQTGLIAGNAPSSRHLSDLPASFADATAYRRMLAQGNPLLYQVTQIEENDGPGQLHYGLGVLFPGKVGDEYYMTKGHLHAWRPAAEVYVGLAGHGVMLLEDERTGESACVALQQNTVVYVPGYTAHRTINTGTEPLVYWGILDSAAGHDYGAVGERNFRQVVVEIDGSPVVLDRTEYLRRINR